MQKTENSSSLKQRLPPQFEEMVIPSVPGGRMKERSSNKEDRLQVCERSSLTLSSWVTGRSLYKEDKTAGIWTRRHQAKLKGVMSHSKQGFKQSMHPGSSQAQNFPPTQLLQCWQPGLNPSDKSSEKSCLCNLTSPDQPRRKNCMYWYLSFS